MPFAHCLIKEKNGLVTEIRCGRKCRKAVGTGKLWSGLHLHA